MRKLINLYIVSLNKLKNYFNCHLKKDNIKEKIIFLFFYVIILSYLAWHEYFPNYFQFKGIILATTFTLKAAYQTYFSWSYLEIPFTIESNSFLKIFIWITSIYKGIVPIISIYHLNLLFISIIENLILTFFLIIILYLYIGFKLNFIIENKSKFKNYKRLSRIIYNSEYLIKIREYFLFFIIKKINFIRQCIFILFIIFIIEVFILNIIDSNIYDLIINYMFCKRYILESLVSEMSYIEVDVFCSIEYLIKSLKLITIIKFISLFYLNFKFLKFKDIDPTQPPQDGRIIIKAEDFKSYSLNYFLNLESNKFIYKYFYSIFFIFILLIILTIFNSILLYFLFDNIDEFAYDFANYHLRA